MKIKCAALFLLLCLLASPVAAQDGTYENSSGMFYASEVCMTFVFKKPVQTLDSADFKTIVNKLAESMAAMNKDFKHMNFTVHGGHVLTICRSVT